MFTKIWGKFYKSEFSRNVSSQILGTGVAQALPFLATPILTRLYNEQDFALYTSYFALATIFAVAVGGKYHMAIVLPKARTEALKVFTLSIYITLPYVLILLLGFFMIYGKAFQDVGDLVYLVPVFVLFFGIWSSFSIFSIREKKFKNNAFAKVIQALFYVLSAVAFGFLKMAALGLVIAKLLGTLTSAVYLYFKSKIKPALVAPAMLKGVAKKYIDYPKYGVAPAFLNTVSTQALILVLAKWYSTEDLGYYGLTHMVLSAPLGLVGNSFRDVFYQKIASLVSNQRFAEAIQSFKKSALALLGMGLPICIILFFFGDSIFSIVFGSSWGRSGHFASILALSFLVKLIVSPLSSIFNATNRLKISSIWQVTYFCTTFLTLGYCAYVLKLDVIQLLYIYVIHEVVLYILYFLLEYRTLLRFKNRNQI